MVSIRSDRTNPTQVVRSAAQPVDSMLLRSWNLLALVDRVAVHGRGLLGIEPQPDLEPNFGKWQKGRGEVKIFSDVLYQSRMAEAAEESC